MQNLKPARILVVDDNRSIHDDFRKILCDAQPSAELTQAEAALFGEPADGGGATNFRVDSAYQGQEALRLVQQAREENDPYQMAFMDVRMPPGWDGIETTAAIWKRHPDLQVVICTAYSDYSWDDLHARLGHTDRLVILKKPFDNIEVLQLAHALTEKWRLSQQAQVQMDHLEEMVQARTWALQEANQMLAAEVNERKEIEQALRASQELLLRQERLAVVGQLAAGVAHDFNNIMTIVQGHMGLLLATERLSPQGTASLNEIAAAATRAAGLTQQLLAFSGKQVMRLADVDIAGVTKQLSGMLARALGDKVSLQCAYAPNLPLVRADTRQIEQVLLNLISNARDAMPDGGVVRISLHPVAIRESDAHEDRRAGQFVCLSVRDNGCGIDPTTKQKIFEPFFTTKDVGRGTGLGLSTVHGIAKQHRGWVEVESELGRGAEFRVYLPVAQSAAVAMPSLETAPPVAAACAA